MIEQQGLNLRLSFAIAAGAFGSAFQHGYNTGVLNAPQKLISDWIAGCDLEEVKKTAANASDAASNDGTVVGDGSSDHFTASGCVKGEIEVVNVWAWIVAIYCIGGMMGGASVSLVSAMVGRKGGLLLNNVLVVVGVIFLSTAQAAGSFEMLIVGRLIMGINSGLNAGLCPMYLSEISPVSLRGATGTVYQLIITISILLSQVLGMQSVLGTEQGWPFLLGLCIVPAVLQVATLPFCPESPKYLLLDRDDEERATCALTWLRGRLDVHEGMDEMRAEQESMKIVPKVNLKEMVFNGALRKPLIIAMMMMLAQQLSGINAAIFYSTNIFREAQLDQSAAQSATLGMGCINVIMTIVSLVLIEKAGRKALMLVGLSVMVFATILVYVCLELVSTVPALGYLSIAMVYLFIVGFATGPGSIPWFIVTELFNQSGRPIATSLAVFINWFANFLVGVGFAPLQLAIGAKVFIIFIVLQILFAIYIYFKVPETKNKTIEEITAQFRQNV